MNSLRLVLLLSALLAAGCPVAGGSDDDDASGDDDDDFGGCADGGQEDGDVELSSDAEIAAFFSEFTSVEGSLTVSGSDVTDPEPLACLEEVGDGFFLVDTALLEVDLAGLTDVGGDDCVIDSPGLEEVTLDALEMDDTLWIDHAPSRSGFVIGTDGLDTLRLGSVESLYWLEISGGPREIDFTGLEEVEVLQLIDDDTLAELVLPSLTDLGSGLLENNDALTAISFPSLGTIAEDLEVNDNPSLLSIDLSALTWAGQLWVDDGPELQSMDLSVLGTVWETFRIEDCSDLSQLAAPLLEDTGYFWLENLPSLTSASFPQLGSVFGDLRLEQLRLTDLDTFSSLSGAVEDLHVERNPVLQDVTGLHGITAADAVYVRFNPQLPMSAAWDLVAAVGESNIGGTISVEGNAE